MSTNADIPVEWLRLALQDMHKITTHIAQDSPEAATAIAKHIWQEAQSLCRLPDRGRPGRVYGTRELILQRIPYFIAYRVKSKKIQIIRVIHTSR